MRKLLTALAVAGASLTGVVLTAAQATPQADPTAGLKQYSDTFKVQHPYNLPESARFSTTAGPEYNAWIMKGDKPFSQGSGTGPRTEMRWGTNWSQTEHQWSADVLIDSGTEGACIMQVKGSTGGEAVYINVHNNGGLYNSVDKTPIATGMWGKWFHLNTDFNPANGSFRVWINGNQVLSGHYSAPASKVWYFKNGVYNTTGAKAEAHFKNITFWAK
ncbi:polysaccharide lyase family 7 protein [Kutzneria buriramensis]|uniref:Alginate lyase n=1 Tax=Kutzneria buriramensis TaxID=1045776 RepID=A0A3E0HFU7_9PSEU|nr:polysaccharide lyase family 7 protein [Kutzneria buriramensis]REH44623.1 alginate lyase [Kutzneria buriramensis]